MNIKRCRRTIHIISVFLLVGVMVVLSGCIVAVIQPDSVVAGQTIVAKVLMEPNPDVLPDTTYPLCLGVRLPYGWHVIGNPTYSGGPTGTLTYEPYATSDLDTQLGIISNTLWWGGSGPGEYWTPEVTVTAIITIQTSITASSTYTLNYVAGYYEVADETALSTRQYYWSDVVSKSITMFDNIVYLPIILNEQ
jgi:hypothetical protein